MIRSILFLLAAAFVALINIPSCLIWHFRSRTDKAGAYDKATRICHTWIRPIAKLGGVDLKKRGAVIRRHDMEALDGRPYLLFITHSSMVDCNLMLKATHPDPVSNVMSLEGFNTYTEPLMRSLGVLGKRKFVTDINLVRNIRYCLHTLGTIFVIFPGTGSRASSCMILTSY